MRLAISVPLIGVVYLIALAVQVSMNIELVASARAGSRMDLVGFVAMMSAGFILAVNEAGHGTLRIRPALYFTAFGLHVAVVIAFTSESQLLAVFLSKYGILTWTLAGSFAALAISGLTRRLSGRTRAQSHWHLLAYWLPPVMLAIVLFPLRGYMASPHAIESYQFAAANATVLFIVVLMAAAHWSPVTAKPAFLIQGITLLVFGTILTFLVSRMNSTSIVLVWVVLTLLYVRASGSRLRVGYSILFTAILVAGTFWLVGTESFAELLNNTRFQELSKGNMELSSLTNRLALVPTFWTQFSVSPLIGDFEAEVRAGYLPGEYIHSLPLSLLTHSGIIGALLFGIALFGAISQSYREGSPSAVRSFVRHVVYAVLAVATVTTFFLWIPLWFMIGFVLVRPRTSQGDVLGISIRESHKIRGANRAGSYLGFSP